MMPLAASNLGGVSINLGLMQQQQNQQLQEQQQQQQHGQHGANNGNNAGYYPF